MKLVMLLPLCLPALAAPSFFSPASAQEPDARAVLRTAMERHGSRVLDNAVVEYRLFGVDFRIVHEGGCFRYEHIHDDGRREVFDNEGITIEEGGRLRAPSAQERVQVTMNLNGGRYMTLLPHRLDDPQVRARYLESMEIDGEAYHEIAVTFEGDTGLGSDNRFVFWVHRDEGTIDYRAVDFFLPGRGRRTQNFSVAVNPRRVTGVLFTDWIQYGSSPELGRRIEDYPEAWSDGALEETGRFEPRGLRVRLSGRLPAHDAARPRTVEEYAAAFQSAVRAYDVDRWVELVAEDVVMISRGRSLEGREAFHERWSAAFEGASGPNPLEITLLDVERGGELVAVRATYGPEGSDPVGHYIWLLQRGPGDGLLLKWWMLDRAG